MNVILYYPRLLAALLWRPLPTNHATFRHWVYAHIFLLWNQEWHDSADTLGMQSVRMLKESQEPTNPLSLKARRAAFVMRYLYLLLLFVWPLATMVFSLRQGRRFFSHWNELANNLILFFQRPDRYERQNPMNLSGLSLYIPLLYISTKTGWRLPDQKDEIYEQCRKWKLPTPRIYTPADAPLPPGRYFVKLVDGCRARGVLVTTEPAEYLNDPRFVVQDTIRNVPELRRCWGTDALGTLRFATLLTAENKYDVVGCVLRMPVGDSIVDNPFRGNAYAVIDEDGTIVRVHPKFGQKEGIPCHPTTGIDMKGLAIPQFEACKSLARLAHQRIAPEAPFFNADIAVTEQGPMIIEYNNAPGLASSFFAGDRADRFVDALCRAIAAAFRHASSHTGATVAPIQYPNLRETAI